MQNKQYQTWKFPQVPFLSACHFWILKITSSVTYTIHTQKKVARCSAQSFTPNFLILRQLCSNHYVSHTHTHLTDRLSSMSHFLFPIKGFGYSSLRPFSAKKWNCCDKLRSKELQNWILYILMKNSRSPKRNEMTKKKCRYVHILVYCMELRWQQPCSDSVAHCC